MTLSLINEILQWAAIVSGFVLGIFVLIHMERVREARLEIMRRIGGLE